MFLAAFDLQTGEPIWDETYAAGGLNTNLGFGGGLAASQRLVAIVGTQSGDGAPGDTDGFVRVYETKTGAFVWEDVFGEDDLRETTQSALIKGRRLYVGGSQQPEGGSDDYLVRAYDLATGAPSWTQSAEIAGSESTIALALTGTTLLSFTEGGDPMGRLRGHDVRTGIPRWDTDFDELSVVFGIAAKGRRVVVPQNTTAFGIDAKTGAVVWDGATPGLNAAVSGKLAIVPGRNGVAAFTLR